MSNGTQAEKPRLLVVEDDPALAQALALALSRRGFHVSQSTNGKSALERATREEFAVIVLDLTLPEMDGLDVLREVRAHGTATPVIVLTARGTVGDRVQGLRLGADDYLPKPFDLDELEARIHALLRRQAGRADAVIRHGALELHTTTHAVRYQGKPVVLSAREFALLHALLDRPGAVLSVFQLEEKMYGWGDEVGSNTVEVYIHALRRKLDPGLIKNVRGVGYMVAAER